MTLIFNDMLLTAKDHWVGIQYLGVLSCILKGKHLLSILIKIVLFRVPQQYLHWWFHGDFV